MAAVPPQTSRKSTAKRVVFEVMQKEEKARIIIKFHFVSDQLSYHIKFIGPVMACQICFIEDIKLKVKRISSSLDLHALEEIPAHPRNHLHLGQLRRLQGAVGTHCQRRHPVLLVLLLPQQQPLHELVFLHIQVPQDDLRS
jgi:hypothetical protein